MRDFAAIVKTMTKAHPTLRKCDLMVIANEVSSGTSNDTHFKNDACVHQQAKCNIRGETVEAMYGG